ncbi:hypothetical protein QH494_19180 [Sphingomonas sp. AR_OL41]|uniref:hypothetical protein n=1 Tax=Sphingomonas sp. AR_OL41 TaxID=3042729 RepID=UPI0024805BC7|nr:hypothetical protein [Sphingomonas sp. AR_OL41]MDH7974317.1 hypothetical protein [Sphingomonas sp. AR_OL41]
MRLASLLALLSFAIAAAPTFASDRPAKARDPNQIVCENQEVLGSRLATRRVCMTRAQWAEHERDDRATVNRSQTQLCVASGGQCSRGQ